MWIDGTELRGIEASLLRHLPGENAAGPIRAVAERTRDFVVVAGRVAEILNGGQGQLTELVDGLLVRLELGVPEHAIPLARAARRQLERGDYLALLRENLVSADAIRAAKDERLLLVLRDPRKLASLRAAAEGMNGARERELLSEEQLPMPKAPAV